MTHIDLEKSHCNVQGCQWCKMNKLFLFYIGSRLIGKICSMILSTIRQIALSSDSIGSIDTHTVYCVIHTVYNTD